MKDKNRKMNDVRIYREVIDSELERIGSSLSDTRYPALLDGSGSTHAEETNWQLMKYTDLFVFLCETYRHTQFAGVAKACMEGREKISQKISQLTGETFRAENVERSSAYCRSGMKKLEWKAARRSARMGLCYQNFLDNC